MHQQQITKHIKHPHRYGGRHNGSGIYAVPEAES